jgi:ectoine hydroxylase-related dioxygenase (phytanoyl-CoA dioxygenase family)
MEDHTVHLKKFGWCVIPDIITAERASEYISKMWDWLEGLNTGVDRNNQKTWEEGTWPKVVGASIFHQYNAGHAQFMWDIRSEGNVIGAFSKIWGTDKLIVSFDGFGIMRPPELTKKDYNSRGSWYHFDQAFTKREKCCIQGFVNLEESGHDDGALMVYERSHLLFNKFASKFGLKVRNKNFYMIKPEQELWLREQKGIREVKVLAPKGSLVLWDSRTAHCNVGPCNGRKDPLFRYVAYISMVPIDHATEADLKNKRDAFLKRETTSHWPQCTNIFTNHFKNSNVRLVLTDRAKQLAGVSNY